MLTVMERLLCWLHIGCVVVSTMFGGICFYFDRYSVDLFFCFCFYLCCFFCFDGHYYCFDIVGNL